MRPGDRQGGLEPGAHADRPGLRIADLGELGLLERIAARVGRADADVVAGISADVVVGIGDDTAALRWPPGALVLLTTDALVEDVHFRRATSAPADVGWKALAINASDIAAMGGTPRHAVVSLMLPGGLEAAWVDGLYDGILELAREAGIAVVGGNLAQAPAVVVDVALVGSVEPGRLLRRDGARPGDLLAVTGTLGRAAAGLLVLEWGEGGDEDKGDRADHAGSRALGFDTAAVRAAVAAQRRPRPRLAEGCALAAAGGVRAMIDLSDGLALDLWRLCEAGGLGARLDADRLPVDPCVGPIARAAGCDPLEVAIAGGEDYELLFAVAPDEAARVLADLRARTGTTASVIGAIEEAAAGRHIIIGGKPRPLEPGGWKHFQSKHSQST